MVVGCKYFLPVPEYQFLNCDAQFFLPALSGSRAKAIPDVDRIRYLFLKAFEVNYFPLGTRSDNVILKGVKEPIFLLIIGMLLSLALFFLDESRYSLSFLTDENEVVNLVFFSVLVNTLPLILYHFLLKKYKTRTFYVSLLEFVPVLLLIFRILLPS